MGKSCIWVNYNDLTVLPRWNHGKFVREIIPKLALIHVSEIL